LRAAKHAELDNMRGVSANVMCGQEGFFGTSLFQVVLNIEEMMELDAVSEYKPVDVSVEIENFFEQVENPLDACSRDNLLIQNNVSNIKTIDMGDDNNYNPGF
jgi:DNA-directed RNA polymerase II subunit RPB1